MSLIYDNCELLSLMVVQFLVNQRESVQGGNDYSSFIVDGIA